MILKVIIILFILALMTIAVYLILKKIIGKIDEEARLYFTLKSQAYTNEIEEKEKKEKKETVKEIVKEVIPGETKIIYEGKNQEYAVDDIFKMVKKVDEKFNLDNEEIINTFIKDYVDVYNASNFLKAKKIENYINDIGVYNIITSNNPNEEQEIIDYAKKIDEKMVDRYLNIVDKFDVQEFMNFIVDEKQKSDPLIYIYVGKKNVNYNEIDPRIRTIYSPKIVKGLKIIYKSKMYDYSIS